MRTRQPKAYAPDFESCPDPACRRFCRQRPIAILNTWLDAHGGATVKYVTSSGAPVFYGADADRPVIEQHIVGVFSGWRGHTVFTLDNGQQWQQAESGVLDTGKISNPAVKIKPMLLGSWLMYVDGCGCNVRVQRIK